MQSGERNSHVCSTPQTARSAERHKRIRELNDEFRSRLTGGRVTITSGIDALGLVAVTEILDAVRRFDEFSADNDPYGEHDFGALTCRGHSIFWKIECYDAELAFGSPDPSDPAVTTRVITIMLASEY